MVTLFKTSCALVLRTSPEPTVWLRISNIGVLDPPLYLVQVLLDLHDVPLHFVGVLLQLLDQNAQLRGGGTSRQTHMRII